MNRFNQICLAASLFFLVSTMWLLRDFFVKTNVVVEKSIPAQTQSITLTTRQIPAIPEEINLLVPFTSQAPEGNWDQPWQDACEEAAVLMLDAYYSSYKVSPFFARDEIIKMVAWQDERGWGYSIPMSNVLEFAHAHVKGRTFSIVEKPSVEDLKRSIAHGHPVLAVAYGKDLPNPYYSGDGPEYHALIIKGYTDTHFITNDPGTRHGADFPYTYEDLMNAIHDWNDGDVKHGKPLVLMVQ